MTLQVINIGSAPNDGTGDTLRDAYDKCNDNFDELYGLIRAEGNVSLSAGNNVVVLSSAFASTNYSVVIFDVNGVGISLTSQATSFFQVNALGAGLMNYVAILNF